MTEEKQSPVYVLTVKGQNWMGLEIDLKLGKGVVEVAGENMAGKTRVLQAVEALLGKEAWPEVPLSEGKTKGELEIQIGGEDEKVEYIVKWRLTAKGGMTLKGVQKATGETVREPQEFLKALCGRMIDPWHFIRLAAGSTPDRKKAVAIFKSLVTVACDLDSFLESQGHKDHDSIKTLRSIHADDPLAFIKAYDKFVCEHRKTWKDHKAKLEGSVKVLQEQLPADKRDAQIVDVQALTEKYKSMSQTEVDRELAKSALVAAKDELKQIQKELKEAERVVEERMQKLASFPPYDEEEAETIENQIRNVNFENEMAQKAMDLRKETAKLNEAEAKVEKITESIERIREFYQETLESAEIPVKGLEIIDDHLVYNGLPLAQASKTEALREVSIPIGIALKPGLRTFVIRDADSMTTESRDILREAVEKYDMQAILEIAMSDEPAVLEFVEKGGVYIKNGVAKNT